MGRKQLTNEQIGKAVEKTVTKLNCRLKQKGYGTFVGTHEILGVITEEYYELIDAVHRKKQSDIEEELIDLAVGCIFATACINADNTIYNIRFVNNEEEWLDG